MPIHKLQTDKTSRRPLAALKAPGYHNDGGGLYLHVSPTLAGSWLFRYRDAAGKDRWQGLGAEATVGIDAAREAARLLRLGVKEGRNPAEDIKPAKPAKAVPTFAAVMAEYFQRHPYQQRQWQGALRLHALPHIGDMPVNRIGDEEIDAFIVPLWTRMLPTAERVRLRVEAILDFATVQKYRDGANPARWKRHLQFKLGKPGKIHKRKRRKAMPHDQVPAFVQRLQGMNSLAARAMEFVLLTACRAGDVIGQKDIAEEKPPIRWEHVNIGKRVWTPPSIKTDTGHDAKFEIVLCDRAAEILETIKAQKLDPDFVFPSLACGGASLGKNALQNLLAEMTEGAYHVHGFRTAFRTWVDDCTSADWQVAETCLSHKVPGNSVTRSYRATMREQRRLLIQQWSDFVTGRTAPAEVLTLRQRKAA